MDNRIDRRLSTIALQAQIRRPESNWPTTESVPQPRSGGIF